MQDALDHKPGRSAANGPPKLRVAHFIPDLVETEVFRTLGPKKGGWHRMERTLRTEQRASLRTERSDATNGAPGLTTRNKKLLGAGATKTWGMFIHRKMVEHVLNRTTPGLDEIEQERPEGAQKPTRSSSTLNNKTWYLQPSFLSSTHADQPSQSEMTHRQTAVFFLANISKHRI